jgi:hypothetical protein
MSLHTMSVIGFSQILVEVARMRQQIIAAGCLSLFCTGWALGQQSAWNGARWKTLNTFEGTLYVAGFNRGHAAGMREGFKEFSEVIVAARPASSWTAEERKKIMEKAEQIDRQSAVPVGVTMGQLQATVFTFYDDYRNMPVCWDDATRFSSLSLDGNAPTEEELNTARKSGAEGGCK